MNDITELSKGKGFGEKLIKTIVANANKSALIANNRRKDHWHARKGWSMNKGKTLLSQSILTPALYLLYKDRYFPDNADDHEKIKLMEQFRKDHPEYNSR